MSAEAASHLSASLPSPPPLLNAHHVVHDLMLQYLPKTTKGFLDDAATAVYPEINPYDVYYALTKANIGLDHQQGEQPLIFFSLNMKDKAEKFGGYLIFTDRRMIGIRPTFSANPDYVSVPYAWVEDAQEKKGKLTAKFEVRMGQNWQNLTFGDYSDQIYAFLSALCQRPPADRMPQATPLLQVTDEDPIGAAAARAAMPWPDPLCALLTHFVDLRFQSGALDADNAQNLIGRIALHYRNVHCGRGMKDGRWLSAAPKDDLCHAMAHLYGAPLFHVEHPVRTLVFNSKMKSDLGKAAAESAVGLAVMAVTGVGWTRSPRASIPNFAMMSADEPERLFSSFTLGGSRGAAIHGKFPGFVDDILYNLLALEDSILLRRTVYGWSQPLPVLLQADPQHLIAELTQVVGAFDPSILTPRR